jgi:hypothetical protein
MTELELLASGVELVGDVAGAVIRHDRLNGDAAVVEPVDRTSEEGDGRRRSFIGQNLGIGQSGGVVDGDMDELPADAASLDRVVPVDAVTDATDTAQLLDIDVDELARAISLVPNDRDLGLEAFEAGEAITSQDAGDGRRAEPHTESDLRPRVSSLAQPQNFFDPIRMGLPWHSTWPRTPIDQGRLAGLSESFLPLEGRTSRYTGRLGGPGHRHSSQDPANQKRSTHRSDSGILVKLHLGSSGELLALDTSSLTDLGPDGQQTSPVNNVLRNEN